MADLQRFRPTIRFAAARHGLAALLLAAALGLTTAWIGADEMYVPSSTPTGETLMPLWKPLSMGAAVIPVLGLYSSLRDLEVVTTARLRRMENLYLAATSGLGAMVFVGLAAVALTASQLFPMIRSLPTWFGLALLSGRVAGWRLAWVLPLTAGTMLIYLAPGDQNEWWDITEPTGTWAAYGLSLGCLLVGLGAYWLTAWRRRSLLAVLQRARQRGATLGKRRSPGR
ncbi:hypothetical protein [Micromonospora sp. DT229]|uniref:hypothetical protein n=1 Tax=Micromonospora sp. DT229 TaxID=3393430 RepID=UPI003CFB63FD